MELGRGDYAKYPFIPESGDFVRVQQLTLYDLVGVENTKILDRARERIFEAAKNRIVSDKSHDYTTELLSFPVALMLVKAAGVEHFIPQYSFAEATRAEHLLEKEDKKELVIFIFNKLLQVPLEEVALKIAGVNYEFRIPVFEYLKRSTQIQGDRWKLVNRPFRNGFVYLTVPDLVRLIREEISGLISDRIRAITLPKLPDQLNNVVEEIRSLAPPPRRVWLQPPSKYPPCVEKALELLKEGRNVPHFARFLMATYLLTVGKTVDDIVALFPRVPDFKEKVTRYQVEHIAGLKGGRVKYRVPSCRTLQLHSFCFKTEECNGIINPVQFGRFPPRRTKALRRNEG